MAEDRLRGGRVDKVTLAHTPNQTVWQWPAMVTAALACAQVVFSSFGVHWVTAARATTITNRDSKTHELTVLHVKPAKTVVLAPSSQVHDLCPTGCVVRLNGSATDDYRLEGTELISLEDGALYYDGEQPDPQQSKPESGDRPNAKPDAARPGVVRP